MLVMLSLISIVAVSSSTVKERVELAFTEAKEGIEQPEYTSVGLRILFYTETVKMLPKYLIWGARTGGFLKAYETQVGHLPYPANTLTADPHNQYLRILVEQGI